MIPKQGDGSAIGKDYKGKVGKVGAQEFGYWLEHRLGEIHKTGRIKISLKNVHRNAMAATPRDSEKRYKVMEDTYWNARTKTLITAILHALKLEQDDFKLGKDLVFFKAGNARRTPSRARRLRKGCPEERTWDIMGQQAGKRSQARARAHGYQNLAPTTGHRKPQGPVSVTPTQDWSLLTCPENPNDLIFGGRVLK